jgi:hypothetical protein
MAEVTPVVVGNGDGPGGGGELGLLVAMAGEKMIP